MVRPSEKVMRTAWPAAASAFSPVASMKKIALSSSCAILSVGPPPCGSRGTCGCERSRSVTVPRLVWPARVWMATRCSPGTISAGAGDLGGFPPGGFRGLFCQFAHLVRRGDLESLLLLLGRRRGAAIPRSVDRGRPRLDLGGCRRRYGRLSPRIEGGGFRRRGRGGEIDLRSGRRLCRFGGRECRLQCRIGVGGLFPGGRRRCFALGGDFGRPVACGGVGMGEPVGGGAGCSAACSAAAPQSAGASTAGSAGSAAASVITIGAVASRSGGNPTGSGAGSPCAYAGAGTPSDQSPSRAPSVREAPSGEGGRSSIPSIAAGHDSRIGGVARGDRSPTLYCLRARVRPVPG